MQKIILHTNIKQMGPRTFGPIQRNIWVGPCGQPTAEPRTP